VGVRLTERRTGALLWAAVLIACLQWKDGGSCGAGPCGGVTAFGVGARHACGPRLARQAESSRGGCGGDR